MEKVEKLKSEVKQELKKGLKQKFILLIVAVVLLSAYYVFNNYDKFLPDRYAFVLDNEQLNEIVQCENQWHYNDILFIPCLFNDSIPVVLYNDSLDYTLSPNANCEKWNATFPGFHQDQNISQERYNSIMPRCMTIKAVDINQEFLKDFECRKSNKKECIEWQREDLIIRKL